MSSIWGAGASTERLNLLRGANRTTREFIEYYTVDAVIPTIIHRLVPRSEHDPIHVYEPLVVIAS